MSLSVIIPARNEEGSLERTVSGLIDALRRESADFEIVIVDDGSVDRTKEAAQRLAAKDRSVRYVYNEPPHGFGRAVRKGLAVYRKAAVVIVMADGSDSPDDVVAYCRKLREGYDCVFGSRFIRAGSVTDYPAPKLILNRIANHGIRFLFGIRHNDITNAFKCYRREVIDGIQPIRSCHFNLTVELPLKAIVRGYSYATIPIRWQGREKGVAKFKIKEMGSRYLFVIFSVLFEKWLPRGGSIEKKRQ